MADVAVLGGELNAGNLGVSALGMATAAQLRAADPSIRLALQNARSEDETVTVRWNGSAGDADSLFFHPSARLRDRSGTLHLATFGRLAQWAPGWMFTNTPLASRTLRRILQTDVVIDLSAGDSFSDIYGARCFRAQADAKKMVLGLGRPLILGPQTYGPYKAPEAQEETREILRRAAVVATREAAGLEELEELLGEPLDERFCQCPDVAFSLEPDPVDLADEPFFAKGDDSPIVGINVSGLLYLSTREFGLRFSYRDLVKRLIGWFVKEVGVRVLLVPHVLGHFQAMNRRNADNDFTDIEAIQALSEELDPGVADRVGTITKSYSAAAIKSVMRECDFFVGARMHSCIGALSQCVPTVTLAYSKKVAGVMALAGVGETMVDPRQNDLEDCFAMVREAYERRAGFRQKLEAQMPRVKDQIRGFFVDRLAPELKPQLASVS